MPENGHPVWGNWSTCGYVKWLQKFSGENSVVRINLGPYSIPRVMQYAECKDRNLGLGERENTNPGESGKTPSSSIYLVFCI